jgi:hypothetical protein
VILQHDGKKATSLYMARQRRKSLREDGAGGLCLSWAVYWHGGFLRFITFHLGMALANKKLLTAWHDSCL